MNILMSILAVIGVILLFSAAVFIHEFGHFLAARILGFRVDAFSIGFGPALWKKTVGNTEYRISAIPFGGYVALPQLDPTGMDKLQGSDSADNTPLPDAAPWKRIIVSMAGPFGNIVLAVLLALLIAVLPNAHTGATSTKIGYVSETSLAYAAGLRTGDTILAVNDNPVETWIDFRIENQLAGEAGHATFRIRRGDEIVTYDIPYATNTVLGVKDIAGIAQTTRCIISSVNAESPAASAGILPNDEILSVNGESILGTFHFIDTMDALKDAPRTITIRREGSAQPLSFTLTPTANGETGRFLIGVTVQNLIETAKPWMMYRNPWRQLKWDALSVKRVLVGLITPKESKAVAKNIGGPVTIVTGLYSQVRGNFTDALGFLRMICINLAILNLLPIPVLDGGHIIFALYEIITRRKPNAKLIAVLVNCFAYLLIALMILLTFTDSFRLFKINREINAIEAADAAEAEQP